MFYVSKIAFYGKALLTQFLDYKTYNLDPQMIIFSTFDRHCNSLFHIFTFQNVLLCTCSRGFKELKTRLQPIRSKASY